jgi:hypothetical protein
MDEVGAELRAYLDALGRFVRRIFADRAGFHDPRVLRPTEYEDAAKGGSVAKLAAIFDGIVFDAPPVFVAADVAAEAFLAGQDRPNPVAPPEPAGAEVGWTRSAWSGRRRSARCSGAPRWPSGSCSAGRP